VGRVATAPLAELREFYLSLHALLIFLAPVINTFAVLACEFYESLLRHISSTIRDTGAAVNSHSYERKCFSIARHCLHQLNEKPIPHCFYFLKL
jgi:hypothetical protein